MPWRRLAARPRRRLAATDAVWSRDERPRRRRAPRRYGADALADPAAAAQPRKGIDAVYETLDAPGLKAACRARSVAFADDASKASLLALLTDDDAYAAELRKDAAREAAADAAADAKTFSLPAPAKRKRKLSVRTVGRLQPTKFTTSGWASCTADVLRDLAGKPRDDPRSRRAGEPTRTVVKNR